MAAISGAAGRRPRHQHRATGIASPQASAAESIPPHETTEPTATTRVTAGSSEIVPVSKTGPVGDIGLEEPPFPSGAIEIAPQGGAECGAFPPDPPAAPPPARPRDPLLRLVVRRWRRLTAEQCLAIVKIATAQERSSAVPRKAPRSAARRILDFGQGAGGKD